MRDEAAVAHAAGGRGHTDALWVASLVLVLTFLVPPYFVLAQLGAAGRPAMLLGIAMFVWWLLTRFHPELATHGRQPVRTLVLALLALRLLSYAAGYDRGLDGVEALATDREMLTAASLAGVALCVADGIRSRAQLSVLVGRLVLAGVFMAVVGILQAFASFDLSQYLRPPGLSLHTDVTAVGERGEGVTRVAGTARHYIEFGAVTAMLVPLAIHRARFAGTPGRRQAWWVSVALLAGAVPLAVSRTGIVALVVAVAVYAASWGWRMRTNAAVLGAAGTVVCAALVPGLLGTLGKLFANAGDDPSVQARQEDYGPAFEYISQRPWLGRGPGTFLPDRYILLDNQYLYTMITEGYVGLVALVFMFVFAIGLMLHLSRRAADAESRDLAQALAGLFLAGAVVSATFDSFSFAVFGILVFFALGCAGALRRLAVRTSTPIGSRRRSSLPRHGNGAHQ